MPGTCKRLSYTGILAWCWVKGVRGEVMLFSSERVGSSRATTGADRCSTAPRPARRCALAPQHPSRRRIAVVCAASSRSLYEVLGVPQSASERDIKSAYRKKAIKLHPDVNKAPDAQQSFMEAKMAYETLSNATSRAEYDRRLRMGFGSAADWQRQGFSGAGASSSSGRSSGGGYGGFGGYGGGFKQEENYSLEDLLRDLDKEFSSWNEERKARKQARGGSSSSSSEPKSLLDELGMLGEELVDFLEDAIGVKDEEQSSKQNTSKASTSSSSGGSGSSGRRKSPIDEFEELWSKYVDPQEPQTASSSAGSGSAEQQKRSTASGNGNGTGSRYSGSSSSAGSNSTASTSSSQARGGGTSGSKKTTDEDIDAMLAELKRKVRKD